MEPDLIWIHLNCAVIKICCVWQIFHLWVNCLRLFCHRNYIFMWVISTSDWLMLTICTICVVPSVSGSWKAYDFYVLTYYYVESIQQYIPRCKTISNPAAEGRPMAWSYWSCYCIIINSCSSVATAKSIAMVMWNNILSRTVVIENIDPQICINSLGL